MRALANRIKNTLPSIIAATLTLTLLGTPLSPISHVFQPAAYAADVTPTPAATALWNQVKDTYAATSYGELVQATNPRITILDQTSARAALRAEGNLTPTPEQLNAKAIEFKGAELALGKTFAEVMGQLDTLMPQLIQVSNPATLNADYLNNQRKRILVGLTYLKHYYGFDLGDKTAFERFTQTPEAFNYQGISVLNLLDNMGGANYIQLLGTQTETYYKNRLSALAGAPDITSFIAGQLTQHDPGATLDAWLRSQTGAIINEEHSHTSLWQKFSYPEPSHQVVRNQLLPLLAVKDPSIYVLNNDYTIQYGLTSTYGGANSADFQAKLQQTGAEQKAFWDFWLRTSPNMTEVDKPAHIISVDTMQRGPETGQTAQQRWSPWYGAQADPGVVDFFLPTGMYAKTFTTAVAAAERPLIRYYIGKALGQPGVNTYSHELTHIYDNTIWFNGAKRRETMKVEDFARGIFETENNTQPEDGGHTQYPPYFNLNTAYELGDKRIQNQSPTRFQNPSDIGEYMRGYFDVLYSLDAMEAEATLELSNADKALLLNRISVEPDPNQTQLGPTPAPYSKDVFRHISEVDAANLNTINDLVDNQIVSARVLPKGITTSEADITVNDYVVVPVFEPTYAGVDATDGTGGYLFRLYGHEMLGEYGWEKGFIGYLSNVNGNETAVRNAILTEHGGSMKTFKKAMYQRRIDKYNQMKPAAGYANATEMKAAIKEALAKDLAVIKAGKPNPYTDAAYNATNLRAVKKAILTSYLNSTNDFRSSIYNEKIKWELPVTAEIRFTSSEERLPVKAGDFKVTVTPDANNPAGVTGVPTGEVPVKDGGEVDLSKWQFPTPGTYIFTVTQLAGTDPNITYNTAATILTVTVPENGTVPDGSEKDAEGYYLVAPAVEYTSGGMPGMGIRFVNTLNQRTVAYTPPVIPVTLTENGVAKPFADADFAVEMTLKDADTINWFDGVPAEEVANSGTNFRFPELTISRPGTYTITYRQVPQNDANITYDTEPVVQTLVVEPHPTQVSALQVTSTYTKGGNATEQPSFNNIYHMPGPVVTYTETTEKVAIPVETEVVDDPQLPVGEEQVTEGTPGERTIVKRQRLEDGQPVGAPEILSETVTTPMQKRVVRRGTKPVEKVGEPQFVDLPIYDLRQLEKPTQPADPKKPEVPKQPADPKQPQNPVQPEKPQTAPEVSSTVTPVAPGLPNTGSTAGWIMLVVVILAATGGAGLWISRRSTSEQPRKNK